LCEKIATNGRGWLAATPGKLISEKNVANCNRLGLLLVSAVVAFFFLKLSCGILDSQKFCGTIFQAFKIMWFISVFYDFEVWKIELQLHFFPSVVARQ